MYTIKKGESKVESRLDFICIYNPLHPFSIAVGLVRILISISNAAHKHPTIMRITSTAFLLSPSHYSRRNADRENPPNDGDG